MRGLRFGALAAVAALVLSACATASSGDGESAPSEAEVALFVERLDLVDDAVAAWSNAATLQAAQAAAEMAANLVVGPGGPGYGDRDGDGQIGGEVSAGLLAGLDGSPAGLASALAGNECVSRDVLGGSWEDPTAQWDRMLTAIDAWRPDNNTMPSLPSHPMRIVGWATFTLATDSLELAQEYAGHAKLHVDISRRALDC